MNRLPCAALLLLAGVAPALAQPAPAADEILPVTFTCAGNGALEVVFVNTAGGNSYAVLLDGAELVPMRVAISASGARYVALAQGDGRVLWTKGRTATLYAGSGDAERVVKADCMMAD